MAVTTSSLLGEIHSAASQEGGVRLTVLTERPGWRVEIRGYGIEASTLAQALWLTRERMEQSHDWESHDEEGGHTKMAEFREGDGRPMVTMPRANVCP